MRKACVLIALLCSMVAHAVVIRDDRQQEVNIAKPPQRIVSLLPSLTETVCELGQCQKLVGVDRYSNWPASARAVPRVGGGLDPNIESIVALRPDLVLRLVGPVGQRWMESLNCVVALVFCVGMVWYGGNIVATSFALDEHSSTDFGFPMWIYYSALPAGGFLMFVRYTIRLHRYLFRFDPDTMTVGHTAEHDMIVPQK